MTASTHTLPLATAALALLVSACKPTPPPIAESGPRLYETCAACHGEQGQGNELAGAPALAGLEPWYVKAQLNKFQQGIRGTHPDDVEGLRMRPMALSLERDTELHPELVDAVVDYIATLPPADPEPSLEGGRAEKGQALYAPCTACHGPDGKGNKAQNAPALVHSNDWYMLTQLKKLKTGVRGSNPKDVTGQQMVPMAGTLADEQAMKDVIAYIETLSSK